MATDKLTVKLKAFHLGLALVVSLKRSHSWSFPAQTAKEPNS